MCGIAGCISIKSNQITDQSFGESLDMMSHRGPDARGVWSDGIAHLGNRRLSIIDLPGGNQPMEDETKRYVITFNGAIYNFKELRAELESKGAKFQTHSDTEVILEGFRLYGFRCVNKFNGMFAFAIWDKKKQTLFAARDRLGVKPFYFSHENSRFTFASEIKSIISMPFQERNLDWNSLAYYLSFGYIPSPHSIFAKMRKLLPGQFLTYSPQLDKLQIETYWSLPSASDNECTKEEAEAEVLEKLTGATRLRMVGDVPVGTFLSGGLDSSITTALMCCLANEEVHTFSIGFRDKEFDESSYARKVSQELGTVHHELKLDAPDTGTLEQIICQFDEPLSDRAVVPTYYLSKLAAEHVKVALSGDGADELFGGYDRFFSGSRYLSDSSSPIMSPIWRFVGQHWPNQMKGRSRLLLKSLDGPQRYSFYTQKYTDDSAFPNSYMRILNRSAQEMIEVSTREYMENVIEEASGNTSLGQLMFADMRSYLPEQCLVKVDRASMLASLEVRSPFLDYNLVDYVMGLPTSIRLPSSNIRKELLKDISVGIIPASVINRPKQGFNVPIGDWMRGPWHDWVSDVLHYVTLSDIFERSPVEKMWQEHVQRKRDWTHLLWMIIVFGIWQRRYLTR